jgi:hypothetical protein
MVTKIVKQVSVYGSAHGVIAPLRESPNTAGLCGLCGLRDKDLDECGLDRIIREAGWAFLCVAGQLGATVFGIDEQKALSRAVEQILANPGSAEFNCLEIMRVASETSKRFPGSALCDCLRLVTTYPRKARFFSRPRPPGEGPRTNRPRLEPKHGARKGQRTASGRNDRTD